MVRASNHLYSTPPLNASGLEKTSLCQKWTLAHLFSGTCRVINSPSYVNVGHRSDKYPATKRASQIKFNQPTLWPSRLDQLAQGMEEAYNDGSVDVETECIAFDFLSILQ